MDIFNLNMNEFGHSPSISMLCVTGYPVLPHSLFFTDYTAAVNIINSITITITITTLHKSNKMFFDNLILYEIITRIISHPGGPCGH